MGLWVLLLGPDGRPLIRSHITPAFMKEGAAPDADTVTALDNMLDPALLSAYEILCRMAEGLAQACVNRS